LLGWRIDIKSEEEKRQEVESQMSAMVVPGAPVSVLTDNGIPEALIGVLMAAGITTVEQLGGMTPEQLQEVPGMESDGSEPTKVETIQNAVVAYYAQFETEQGSPEASPDAGEALEQQSVTIETQDSSQGVETPEAEKGE
jgi:N utilization substance protein A